MSSSALPSEAPGLAIAASFSGLEYDRTTQTFNSVLTLTNNGATAATGPLTVVISTGTSAVTVAGSANGSSYIANIPGGQILPGQSAQVVVEFTDPTRVQFTPTIQSIVATTATVSAVVATVTIDPSLPASVTSMVANVVSPLDSQKLGAPLYVPMSAVAGETLVFAVDANQNILLASLTRTNSANLSATSTALALARLEIGAVPLTSTEALNAAIESTAEFPNLVKLIETALTANESPITSSAVYSSIATVLTQLPTSVVATLQPSKLGLAHDHAAPVDSPSVTLPVPYQLLKFPTPVPQVVSVTGSTANGNVQISNSTLIAWALASATTSGQNLCLPNTVPSSANPDCSVVIPQAGILGALGSVVGTRSIQSGTVAGDMGGSFNLALEQNLGSRSVNVVQVFIDLDATIALFTTAGASATLESCLNGFVKAALPTSQTVVLALDPSPAALLNFLQNTFSRVSVVKALLTCAAATLNVNNSGSWTFGQVVTAFAIQLSRFALSEVNGAATAAGLPGEIYWTVKDWSFKKVSFGVCEAKPPGSSALTISNCAQSFAFAPPSATMVPGVSFTPAVGVPSNGSVIPTLYAYLGANGSGATTLVPPDLMYSSPQDGTVIKLDADTGAVQSLSLPSGQTTAQAMVTVTETSTGLAGNYAVNVNSLPTITITATPATVSSSGGAVTLSVTLGPPAGAVPGSPTPTGSVTFVDATGAAGCTQPVTVQAGVATCVAQIVTAPDFISANYSGDRTYASNGASVLVGLSGGTISAKFMFSGTGQDTDSGTGNFTFDSVAGTVSAFSLVVTNSANSADKFYYDLNNLVALTYDPATNTLILTAGPFENFIEYPQYFYVTTPDDSLGCPSTGIGKNIGQMATQDFPCIPISTGPVTVTVTSGSVTSSTPKVHYARPRVGSTTMPPNTAPLDDANRSQSLIASSEH